MPKAASPAQGGDLSYSAPALEKGLDIIELLAAASTPLSTRAIAEHLGRSKGEIFRMVFVLVERGYLIRDAGNDGLALSNRLFELGIRTPRSRQLIEAAAPAMERLSERTGQSAHLVVINRGETVVIATTTGSADISFTLRLGYRRPSLDATSGRIIIACQDAERRAKLISEAEVVSGAVVQRRLRRELDAIRDQGFLVAESHDVIGVTDIGAPIIGKNGRAIAAIVVPYLNRHRAPPKHAAVLEALRAACVEIGEKVG
jgi:DNA-binding IclR family transcriptional regulator